MLFLGCVVCRWWCFFWIIVVGIFCVVLGRWWGIGCSLWCRDRVCGWWWVWGWWCILVFVCLSVVLCFVVWGCGLVVVVCLGLVVVWFCCLWDWRGWFCEWVWRCWWCSLFGCVCECVGCCVIFVFVLCSGCWERLVCWLG